MHVSLGSRPGRTLLHQCCYPEPRPAVPVRADVSANTWNAGHVVLDSGALYVHADEGNEGAVGVDSPTDEEGLTGGSVRCSWWPVSPRCREIHSPWSGSRMTKMLMICGSGVTT